MNDIVSARITKESGERVSKYFEIIVCLGGGKIICKDGETVFSAGQTVIIPPLTAHTVESDSENIHILLERALLPFKKTSLINGGRGGMEFAARQATEFFADKSNKNAIVLSALGELLAAYVTAFSQNPELSPAVAIVKDGIEKNISNPAYSIEDALKKLPLNYDYLRKLFKKETGATPHGYLIERRMELAGKLLTGGMSNRYTQYSVSQVAEMCGFSEPLYFSRVFKKYYGVPPSDYR